MFSFASDRCTEWCDRRPKPQHDTFGSAMPHIIRGDIRSLKRLAWAIYNGMYILGSQQTLSGPHDWACILDKIMTHIYHGRMLCEHCPLSTIGGANTAAAAHLKGDPVAKLSRRRNWQKRPQAPQTLASPASKTPTLLSVINMPSGATSARTGSGVVTASLDLGEEDNEETFHEFNWHRMQQCCMREPSEPLQRVQLHLWKGLSPEQQTIRSLQQCKSEITDTEVVWWPLIDPLTDRSNATIQALAKRLVAMWRWTFLF